MKKINEFNLELIKHKIKRDMVVLFLTNWMGVF